jgi:MoaA/NifB/PqqE/SkfB family radical SAM enzyme
MIDYAAPDIFTMFTTNGILLADRFDELMASRICSIGISVTDEDQANAQRDVIENIVRQRKGRYPIVRYKWFGEADPPPVIVTDVVGKYTIRYPGERWANLSRLWADPANAEKTIECHHPFWNPAVKWDGDFIACCADHGGETAVGNLNEEDIIMLWPRLRAKYHDFCKRCV